MPAHVHELRFLKSKQVLIERKVPILRIEWPGYFSTRTPRFRPFGRVVKATHDNKTVAVKYLRVYSTDEKPIVTKVRRRLLFLFAVAEGTTRGSIKKWCYGNH